MMPMSDFYARMNKYSRSVVCVLYMCFFAFMGLWQTNAEEQSAWEEFRHLNGIPFIVYYPKNFIVDPCSEIRPSNVKYLSPEDKRLHEYYKWCMVLDSPDEALRVRIISYDTASFLPAYGYCDYNTGRELIIAQVFRVCDRFWIENEGEYAIVQGTVSRKSGEKQLIIVYSCKEDEEKILNKEESKLFIFQTIIITEKIPGALEKNEKIIQEIVHRFKPWYVMYAKTDYEE